MKIKSVVLSCALANVGYISNFSDVNYSMSISKELQMLKVTDRRSGKSSYTHLSNVLELVIDETLVDNESVKPNKSKLSV